MAARISDIFFYKESGNVIFFIKNPNLTKLEQVSRGSRIPPASATAFGKQTFYIKL